MKLDNLNLNLTGTSAIALRTPEAPSIIPKLDSVYEEHAKLVFLFDHSGSMSSLIARSYVDMYVWDPELLAAIRTQATAAIAEAHQFEAAMTPPVFGMSELNYKLFAHLRDADTDAPLADDAKLKEAVVRFDLIGDLKVPLNLEKHESKPPTRLEVVKKLAKQEIQKRFDKFPKSKVSVIQFDSCADVLFDEGLPEQLWPVLDTMVPAGGTSVLTALGAGMEVCRKHPSAVGLHHFILVTDGEDWDCQYNIASWVPTLKASGIVLDYIHIGDLEVNRSIKDACVATGGDVVTVNSERELEDKFVAAVQRRCLPAAK